MDPLLIARSLDRHLPEVEGWDVAIVADTPTEPNELAALLGPFWSAAHVAATLGWAEDDLAAAHATGALLGLRTVDDEVVYPTWQFVLTSTGDVVVRPALAAVFRELLDHDPWAVAVLMHTPATELGGQTPLDAARARTLAGALADLARTVRHEWSSGSA